MDSPRTEGTDVCGIRRKLGDFDELGYVIWYIDEDGHCWASCEERDVATTESAYWDAWQEWNRCGGIGPEPAPAWFALTLCRDPENFEAAMRAAADQTDRRNPITRMQFKRLAEVNAEHAQWN